MGHKAFAPRFKSVKDDGTVAFVVATLNVKDKDNDVTLPGFFGHQDVVMLPAHDRYHVPLGKGAIEEDGDEAIATVKFNLKIASAVDWYEAIKFDFENPPSLQEYSYGFRLLEGGAKSGSFQGERVQFLQPKSDGTPGVDVYEVSSVVRGAGVSTRTLAVKGEKQPGSEIRELLHGLGRERYGAEGIYVWCADYDLDELWVVYEISPDDDADRLVRLAFTRDDAGGITLGDEERDVQRTVAYAPKGIDRFLEHAKSVEADFGVFSTRVSEVVALRADKGKRISTESLEVIRRVVDGAKALEQLVAGEPAPSPTDDVEREFARFVSLTHRSH